MDSSSIVVLITDFGDSPYAGILRLVVKSIAPGAVIVDGTHSVPSFSVLAGAYVTYNMYKWAPKGSIVTVVVDPGVGSSRPALAVKAGDYYFVGPDNGVLYPSVAREGFQHGVSLDPTRVLELAKSRFRGKLGPRGWQLSSTFHGRDLFAPAAALIASGVGLEEIGSPISLDDMKKTTLEYVEKTEEGYTLKIVYIDKFGNVALSAPQGSLPIYSWQRALIETPTGTFQAHIGRKFSDVPPGELVLYVNSFGFLEIAANLDSAAKKLGVEIGDKILLTPL